MPVVGLTGGVATGKSTFARLLLREFPMDFFDSDQCVHELLATDQAVLNSVIEAFGAGVLDEAGLPSRAALRKIVFEDGSKRAVLEAILHPRVRQSWTADIERLRASLTPMLVDVPLLFESGAVGYFDEVIVVAATEKMQMHRMIHNRGLAPALAANIIRAQTDLGAKTEQADHVIWNDSTVSNLDGQTRLLASWLRRRFS